MAIQKKAPTKPKKDAEIVVPTAEIVFRNVRTLLGQVSDIPDPQYNDTDPKDKTRRKENIHPKVRLVRAGLNGCQSAFDLLGEQVTKVQYVRSELAVENAALALESSDRASPIVLQRSKAEEALVRLLTTIGELPAAVPEAHQADTKTAVNVFFRNIGLRGTVTEERVSQLATAIVDQYEETQLAETSRHTRKRTSATFVEMVGAGDGTPGKDIVRGA